jgi:diacylglycerol kinase (ATP)
VWLDKPDRPSQERVAQHEAGTSSWEARRRRPTRLSSAACTDRPVNAPTRPHSRDAHRADSRALKGKRGLRRLLNAAGYSLDGFRAAWAHEDAFRQEVILAAIMIPLALWLPVSLLEKILLVGVVVLVLVVELLNTGIEAAIDRDSLEIDRLGKRAKDYGSAAVLLSLLLAGGTWAAILIERFVL